jgi:hypothetical protein
MKGVGRYARVRQFRVPIFNIYMYIYYSDVEWRRLGNSGRWVEFASTRPTRQHNRVQHEPDQIINQIESLNPNTARFPTKLLEHDPCNPSPSFDSLIL